MSPLDNSFYDFLDCRWNATQILSTCINRNISSLSTSCALHDLDEQSKRLVPAGFEDQRGFFVSLAKQERARSFFLPFQTRRNENGRAKHPRETPQVITRMIIIILSDHQPVRVALPRKLTAIRRRKENKGKRGEKN